MNSPDKKSNDFNCMLCNKSDDMFMEQCDDCDAWFHYICIGVTSDVENQAWKCTKCTGKSRKNSQKCHICSYPLLEDNLQCTKCEFYYHAVCFGTSKENKSTTGICIQCEKFSSSKKQGKHDKASVTSRNSQDRRIRIELQRLEEEQRIKEKYLAKKYELLKLNENRSETSTIDDDNQSAIDDAEIDRQENVESWITRSRSFIKAESLIMNNKTNKDILSIKFVAHNSPCTPHFN